MLHFQPVQINNTVNHKHGKSFYRNVISNLFSESNLFQSKAFVSEAEHRTLYRKYILAIYKAFLIWNVFSYLHVTQRADSNTSGMKS